ncbi:MAG: TRAP transporter small permease [Chloroflexi bacterium]|nr:TRAP transporter small permease [Chloroflexota bacterium]
MIEAVFDKVVNYAAYWAGALLIFVMLLIAVGVLGRFLFNSEVAWAVEASEYSLGYITFLGLAWLLKRDGHVRMDVLLSRLKRRNQTLLNCVTSIVGAATFGVVTWFGVAVTWDYFQRGMVHQSVSEIPLAPVLACIPLGSFLFAVQFGRQAAQHAKSWKERTASTTRVEKAPLP